MADARQVKPGGGETYLGYGGDFGPSTTPSDENFCQNGVVTADRVPQPSMGEIRKWQQFVDTRAVDLAKGEVRVDNGYDFTNLAEIVSGRWVVRADDKVIGEGALPALDVPPHASKTIARARARDHPGAGRRVLARPRLRAEGGHAVGEGRPRPRPRPVRARPREARSRRWPRAACPS